MAATRAARILSLVAHGATGVEDLPQRLVQACADSLPITGAGLILMDDSGPVGTVAVTDCAAAVMEELQFTLGEGPCIDASRDGRPVLQPDLATGGAARWPVYTESALALGIRAVFAFPLRVGAIRVGVLDLYRDGVGFLDDDELAEALAYADAATTVLLHQQAQHGSTDEDMAAIPVLEDRAEVHQATGMIAVLAEVTLAEALVLLRARAFAEERPIVELARAVIAGGISFPGLDGGSPGS